MHKTKKYIFSLRDWNGEIDRLCWPDTKGQVRPEQCGARGQCTVRWEWSGMVHRGNRLLFSTVIYPTLMRWLHQTRLSPINFLRHWLWPHNLAESLYHQEGKWMPDKHGSMSVQCWVTDPTLYRHGHGHGICQDADPLKRPRSHTRSQGRSRSGGILTAGYERDRL